MRMKHKKKPPSAVLLKVVFLCLLKTVGQWRWQWFGRAVERMWKERNELVFLSKSKC